MILTITPNASIDVVIFIPEFRPTTNMRTNHVVESVGGKGYDASVVLQYLGAPNLALGFVAGFQGERLVRLLDKYGVQHDLVWVEGETRIAHVIIETLHHRHSHITIPGYKMSPAALEEFLEKYQRQVVGVSWVIGAGSLPEDMRGDFYGLITRIAHLAGAKTLIDCPGDPILQALPDQPDIVKINRSEFASTFGKPLGSIAELNQDARHILEQKKLPSLVITCGEDGILGVTPQASYLATCPPQQAVNAAGAGDAVSALLAWRFTQNDDWPQSLRWAAAASAATVLTEATAEFRNEDVLRLYAETTVRKL